MLFEKLKEAKRNLGLVNKENNIEGLPKNSKEEVVIGHDYIDDNSDYDQNRPDLTEYTPIPDPESPNNLDADSDVAEESEDIKDSELCSDILTEVTASSEFYENSSLKGKTPIDGENVSTSSKEESMDKLNSLEKCPKEEDDSGVTYSEVMNFLEKYADGNDVIQILRKDLMAVLSDIQWIKESENTNEQWALDFADSLNELSVSF